MACPESDRSADLKALAKRLTEAASAPVITDQMRADLNDAADIVWEYIVLIEPEDPTQIAISVSEPKGTNTPP